MQCRSRIVLFLSYLVSLGSIGGGVTILLLLKQQHESEDLWIGAVGGSLGAMLHAGLHASADG